LRFVHSGATILLSVLRLSGFYPRETERERENGESSDKSG